MVTSNAMEKIVSLCKRRGFIFPGSEIYGGLGGFWDFGPLGVELKNNIKKLWWKKIVYERDDVLGLDSTIIHAPKVLEASGHTVSFTDPLVECKNCNIRIREDHLKAAEELFKKAGKTVASAGMSPEKKKVLLEYVFCSNSPDKKHNWTDVKQFNLMFKTSVGPVEKGGQTTYLRPETCQGIFVNFDNVLQTMHPKIPFGIAQIGKGFRNEITTGDFIFRDREFEMMELEYFVKPGEDEKWFDYWKEERMKWHKSLGLKEENLHFFEHPKEALSHYSKRTVDVEYQYPFGWSELEGIANRTDFDLKNHGKFSGRDLSYFDEETKEKYIPYVIEPSVGVERIVLALLVDAYHEEQVKEGIRVVLRLQPKLAPVKVAVFPLVSNKPPLVEKAKSVFDGLKSETEGLVAWDDIGNIGKRYRRQDEIGTPWCVTIDYQTLDDETVTVRDRDTMKQERLKIDNLSSYFLQALS